MPEYRVRGYRSLRAPPPPASQAAAAKLSVVHDEVTPAPEHGTIRSWRASDGAPLRLFDQQTGNYVSSVAFSPLGTEFAYTRAFDGVVAAARSPF
jgi:hypothetical protein